MRKAEVVKNDDGTYRVDPVTLGVWSIGFKKKADAERVAHALDVAHELGREMMKADIRSMLGAASDEG